MFNIWKGEFLIESRTSRKFRSDNLNVWEPSALSVQLSFLHRLAQFHKGYDRSDYSSTLGKTLSY